MITRSFWYYIRNGPLWENYQLRAVIEAETITIADEIFNKETGVDPKSQGISVTLEPL